MGCTAQKDKDMEDLMTSKSGIVPPWPLDGIEYATYGVEDAA